VGARHIDGGGDSTCKEKCWTRDFGVSRVCLENRALCML